MPSGASGDRLAPPAALKYADLTADDLLRMSKQSARVLRTLGKSHPVCVCGWSEGCDVP